MRLRLALCVLVGSVATAAAPAGAVAETGVGSNQVVSARHHVPTIANPTLLSCVQARVHLRMSVESEGLAAGTRVFGVTISSTSKRPCTLTGYPVVTLLGPGGSPLSTSDEHSQTFEARVGTFPVVVDTSSVASFLVTLSTGNGLPSPKPTCPVVTGFDVRLPLGFRTGVRVPRPYHLPASATQKLSLPSTPVPVHAEPNVPGGVTCQPHGTR